VSILSHQHVNLSQALFDRHLGRSIRDPVAECIKPVTHATNTGKQSATNQSRYRFAVFVNDNAVIAINDLVEHLTQILTKIGCCYLSDHLHPQTPL
jgi:hypothetical protein